ncbi:hypothetical protein [Pseudomonas panipatensis]|jgi:hypothetical protein|uniref:Uncharacterized protein n=1 Tax=Pseudomonas panipatensis TaxID=428992 RepID=A0A1G8CFB9_9PSED|nr:hypothetical protein [Pseudomonas panipatensis]SDH44048.1 hypothetical protein SAMN05216272_101551 [Pseudomonas panipatensis]SMP64859.1 hypothetical protein SAMN06295951_106291 [Pseudomonas panipatensis]
MSVWLVILLLALVLSPLTWLLPSRGQRGQMNLRLEARRLGLAMQMARQEWPHWLERQPPRSCAQYHRPRSRGRTDTWDYWQSAPGVWLDRWREPCADTELASALAGLPADVYKVEASAQFIALYWGEHGDSADLQCILAFFTQRA